MGSFTEIRAKSASLREKKATECVVCGLTRTAIEARSRSSFAQHTTEHHNHLHYLRFFYYLGDKATARHAHAHAAHTSPSPLTSHEHYVFKQITAAVDEHSGQVPQSSFVPIQRALCMERGGRGGSGGD